MPTPDPEPRLRLEEALRQQYAAERDLGRGGFGIRCGLERDETLTATGVAVGLAVY